MISRSARNDEANTAITASPRPPREIQDLLNREEWNGKSYISHDAFN
jgi:hypothetical protein